MESIQSQPINPLKEAINGYDRLKGHADEVLGRLYKEETRIAQFIAQLQGELEVVRYHIGTTQKAMANLNGEQQGGLVSAPVGNFGDAAKSVRL